MKRITDLQQVRYIHKQLELKDVFFAKMTTIIVISVKSLRILTQEGTF